MNHPARAATGAASDPENGTVDLIDVARYFGPVAAVDGIDLHVHAGEFLSLLGPSGCGKTTTLRLLAGFEQPDRGEIIVSGHSYSGVPPHKRAVNTVFQAYALFPHMTVAENFAYGLRQRRTSRSEVRARVSDALDMVRMTPMADRKPQQLSGGQQQRVALARALINRPSVLLLDEPLGALDRKLREEMQLELKLLQTELRTTFIFVTHDQEEALAMSDRIAVMLDGHVEQIADPFTIYEQPATAFVAGFLGQQNFFGGTATDAGTTVRGNGLTLRASASSAALAEGAGALAAVRPESILITDGGTPESTNSIRGVLISTSHLGDAVQHVVLAENGQNLRIRSRRAGDFGRARGAEVLCSWSSDSVRIFDDAETGALEAASALPKPGSMLTSTTTTRSE